MTRPAGTYILPMMHPASFFKNQTMQFTASLDWKRAVRIQKEGPTNVHQPIEEWQWRPTYDDVATYIGRMGTDRSVLDSPNPDPGPWSIDFEATLNRDVVCLGIWSCHQPTLHRGICIPFLSQGGVRYWSAGDELRVMDLIRGFFTSSVLGKIGQNTVGYDTGYPPFNARALIKTAWGIDVAGIIGDTMVAHHTCFSELRHGLGFLTSIATDMGPYKEELWDDDQDEDDDDEKDWTRILERPDERVRKYNLKDAFGQAVVWNGLEMEMGAAFAA